MAAHRGLLAGRHLSFGFKSWGHRSACERLVLAIHGWLDNSSSFDLLAPDLVKNGCYVLAMDLLGHGASDHLEPGCIYNHPVHLKGVYDFVCAAGWEDSQFSVVGHSMGGGISLMFASAFPDLVDQVVSIESLGTISKPAEGTPDALRNAFTDDGLLSDKAPRVYSSLQHAVATRLRGVTTNMMDTQSLSPEAATRLVEAGTRVVDGGVVFTHDPRLSGGSPVYFTEAQILACLRALDSTRVLLVSAEDGIIPHLLDDSTARSRIAAVPHAKHVMLPGGHHLHVDPHSAAGVAETVTSFLLSTETE